MNKSQLAAEALKLALKVRNKNKIDIKDSFCVYDLAVKIGFEVRFVDIKSMEGLYVKKPREIILISSHRWIGRQRFTCAHEIGHYLFNHAVHIDEIYEDEIYYRKDSKEMIADLFASYLLMPSTTVNSGFARRKWNIKTATPLQVFTIAFWLGVSYTALINHMLYGIKKITASHAKDLLRETPKEIKKDILGRYHQRNVFFIDFEWSGRPVDLFVDDIIAFSNEIEIDGKLVEYIGKNTDKYLYKMIKPGIGRMFNQDSGWASFIRVSRTEYKGRSKYRHMEDN